MKGWLLVLAFVVVFISPGLASAQATNERISVDSSGAQGNGKSGIDDLNHGTPIGTSLSADGNVVGFASEASNLVAADTNGTRDVFVHLRSTGVTERVSVDSSDGEVHGKSSFPMLSADGAIVVFQSDATTLVSGDTNAVLDVFLRDRIAGTTERISVDSSGNQANGESYVGSCSADGRIVAFASGATNLVSGDTNGRFDVFVHDRSTGITELVSLSSSGQQGNADCFDGSISPDGRFVVFTSVATNLVAGDTNGFQDVFVRDRSLGLTRRISVNSSGVQANGDSFGDADPSISSDGSIVVFTSQATNLGSDANRLNDVFVNDASTGITELVSVSSSGAPGNQNSESPSLSADGQNVAFMSYASNFVFNDGFLDRDVFLHDRSNGETELVDADASGGTVDGESFYPSLSADGQVVAFDSSSTQLVQGDTNGFADVFVRERCTFVAAWSNYGQGFPGTNGVPSFTARSNPVRGSTITLDLGNSSGGFAFGLVFVGYQRTSVHSNWGGDLLVLPALTVPIGLAPTGTSLSGDIPDDDRLCGFVFDLQSVELDPGAAKGISFTAGLELVIGR